VIWPRIAAMVASCIPFPEPPRGGRAAPPPGRLAGCHGALKPDWVACGSAGSVKVSQSPVSSSPVAVWALLPMAGSPGAALPPPAGALTGGTIAIGNRSPGNGVRNRSCEAPFGPFRQSVPDHFPKPETAEPIRTLPPRTASVMPSRESPQRALRLRPTTEIGSVIVLRVSRRSMPPVGFRLRRTRRVSVKATCKRLMGQSPRSNG
jgi:hypothetical protein